MHRHDVLKLELYAFFFVSLGVGFAASKPPQSNLQIVQRQMQQMISECGERIPVADSQRIVLRALLAYHPLNGLVKQQLYTWAAGHGFTSIYEDSTQGQDSPGYLISFMPIRTTIRYYKLGNLGKERQRQIATELHLCVRNPGREILFSSIRSAAFQDTVMQKDIRYLEAPDLAFTRGEPPAESLAAKLFQPLLISLTTAGIIYSFYSFRSR